MRVADGGFRYSWEGRSEELNGVGLVVCIACKVDILSFCGREDREGYMYQLLITRQPYQMDVL